LVVNLLAIETSSEIGTVVLASDGSIVEKRIETPRDQTARILPLVDDLLAASGLALRDLDGIAFGRGPGSFTGLRVAAAVSQGLALAVKIPVLPVSSLAATAQGAWRTDGETHALVCADARMGEVYWGAFEIRQDIAQPLNAETLSKPDAVCWDGNGNWIGLGSGFGAYEDVLVEAAGTVRRIAPSARPFARDLLPRAIYDLHNGGGVCPTEATPVYLRDNSAWEK
jgi:tRNA threonylcarbamoyladenosine biosynthesis protein TsaB